MTFHHSITSDTSLFSLRLKEIWRYRDLMLLFVRRDFVAQYKQTILGPTWFIIQPVLQTLMFSVVFGNIAGLSTDGAPRGLFYLAGITAWNYFAQCLTKTSNVFTANAGLFGKVYFPRAVTPLSIVISNLIQFGIGFFLFLCFYVYFIAIGADVQPNMLLLLLPVLIIMMGGMGLGMGMLISAMTTKYRDLQNLVTFGVQLAMYATPIIYPLSSIPERYRWLVLINPMSSVVETFKYAFLGTGTFSVGMFMYSLVFTVLIIIIGLAVFNKTEKNFMDTV